MVTAMDHRPIGVFDSGLGGLTAVKKLMEVLPREDIVYLGDTGRVPYGSRSRETITKYAGQDAAFLAGLGVKAIVIACNTACSVALGAISAEYDMPVFGVVGPPAAEAVRLTSNKKIGIIGTVATVRSGAYVEALRMIAPDAEVWSAACPLFVPLVENGRASAGDIVVRAVAGEYLAPLRERGVDTLILGCTHYPLLRGVISEIMGPDVAIVDSGAVTAQRVARDLGEMDLLSGEGGRRRYFVTDSTEGFSELASIFLGLSVGGSVEQVTLE
ncbi:MAG: glutamate racemase [Oscillospiraceae bacterium]|jgi:glutamate racemase|nr:glutamate racemase [Oscillospiraceae bacterium]